MPSVERSLKVVGFFSYLIAFYPKTVRSLPEAANISMCNSVTVDEQSSRPWVPGSTVYRFGLALIVKPWLLIEICSLPKLEKAIPG